MIKFFRRIRQRLLSENKFSKYLIYAVGEIVLVVIGILIALQINNWNEERKREDLEIATLKELKSNLLADVNDFRSDMRVYDAIARSSDVVIDLIDGKLAYHDSINNHLGKLPTRGVFTVNKAAYENLKAIGIKLISNDSLRAEVSDLYEGRYSYVENYMSSEYEFNQQHFGEFYLREMKEYAFHSYAKPVDPKNLISNQEFRNLIVHQKIKLQGWFKTQYELNIKQINRVIEMIDREIAHR